MSYDAKFTITRDKLSLTVEAKTQTVQDLHFLAAAVWENNMQNVPWLLDQFFVQLEQAVSQQKKKQKEMNRAGAVNFTPRAPAPARKGRLPRLVKEQVKADLIENKLTLEEIALKYSLPLNTVKGVWGWLKQTGVVAQDTLSGSGNVAEAKP